ncbi:TOBE domain-containing protein [Modestobacter sp. VKM Ac-2978]|uniref:TOBE domain-containing protein n=1 Tax=Modestobacter sp. VKM Ac-2978 TaxID=3004132 RepID=UPI0022AB16FD|nr:TOBE domain-containing protein [Modestobacter sp. VKM Ac-2978]MCZ2849907.1 TOBE domain-containing protein [Modestobacter sp. VKM Ac-2978]
MRRQILQPWPESGGPGLTFSGRVVDALLLGDEYEIIVDVNGWGAVKVLTPTDVDVTPGRTMELHAAEGDVCWVRA